MSISSKYRRMLKRPAPAGRSRQAAVLALLIALAPQLTPTDAAAASQAGKPRRLAQATTTPPPRPATDNPDDTRLLDARDAWQRRDRARLAVLKTALAERRHPLAIWVDYWELGLRLGEVGQDELDAFYARWPGSYLEDRLRNDWLLELGRRRDWRNLATEQPRFRMNDDREVNCYGLIVRHLLGDEVRQPARSAWLAQKEPDEGCRLMAQSLTAVGVFGPADLWARARLAAEFGRPKVMRQALELLAELPVNAGPLPAAPLPPAAPAPGGITPASGLVPGASAPVPPASPVGAAGTLGAALPFVAGATSGAVSAAGAANAAGAGGSAGLASARASAPLASVADATAASQALMSTPPSGAAGQTAAPALNPSVASGPAGALAMTGALAALSPAALASEVFEQPQRFLGRRSEALARQAGGGELIAIALARLAVTDPAQAAGLLETRWQRELRAETAAWAWSAIAKQAAQKFQPETEAWFRRSVDLGSAVAFEWTDDTLAWRVRAALRAADPQRWQRVLEAVTRMSPVEQLDPAWVYWKARALLAIADPGPTGDGLRIAGQLLMERIAGQLNFYGQLANEQLGRTQLLPPAPLPSSEIERARITGHPGLSRALMLIGLGLADEGRREWNFSLRDLGDRDLLAAARMACEREVWDRCIAAAERTRGEIDMSLRFPQPFRPELLAAIGDTGLDPALVYGLIRQESRFAASARSGAGAAGLMQVITPTARHVARQIGLKFHPDMLTDRAINLRIGSAYLRMVLDDFGGSQALALAAYNAGPGRSRRWREGPVLEVAAWAEMIPFTETRDYVKKVLSNAAYYSALMADQKSASLAPRLTPAIAPRPPDAAPENRDLP